MKRDHEGTREEQWRNKGGTREEPGMNQGRARHEPGTNKGNQIKSNGARRIKKKNQGRDMDEGGKVCDHYG